MNQVVIKTRENGPLLITGPVTIVDHMGNCYPHQGGENIALCRCGASLKKPFCDGAHKRSGFTAGETVAPSQMPTE